MIAAIYARKSTDQGAVSDEQRSVARQVEHARGFATSKGWAVDDAHIYVDDGISGAEFAARPGFVRLLNALKPRAPFDVLIMSEESRLGREAIETAYAMKQLIQAGVRVWFYLEGRERTLDSPTDKLLMSVTAFADELEREKARQRTYDAMIRKARAGHVTGGRVFGYDNVEILLADGTRSHVERRINLTEAAVVVRMFELCASGYGLRRIAITLNGEGVAAPRPQQRRPTGWAPSSVREVLLRELYRGCIVWNRTRKRNAWGQHKQHDRPAADRVTVQAPELRIVDEAAWEAAHARFSAARANYLRGTQGQLWGRPVSGTAAKYLLTGLARCGCCGGGVSVKTRAHGRRRDHRYACSSYHYRGRTICGNSQEVAREMLEDVVLDIIRDEVLRPHVIEAAIAEAVRRVEADVTPSGPPPSVVSRLEDVERQLGRLTEAIASGGELASLVARVQALEAERSQLVKVVESAERSASSVRFSRPQLDREFRGRLTDWRQLLGRQVHSTRQILRKLLAGRIELHPMEDGAKCEVRIPLTLGGLLSGVICPQGVASPILASWNQLERWLRAVDGLRLAA